MDSDADRRFRRLAEAIASDGLLPDEDGRPLELDVGSRTFTCRLRRPDGSLRTTRVAVLEHVLTVRPGIGEHASIAWGQDLSDEEGWFRFTLVSWDESIATTKDTGSGWWTFGAGRGAAPVPPWEADDYRHVSPIAAAFDDAERVDGPPDRPKPRRRR